MVRCDAPSCGVELPRQHVAVVIDGHDEAGDSLLAFLCPRHLITWANRPAQQDALARAEGRACGDADGGEVRCGGSERRA